MHRATPANSSFRGYVSGGARATVHKADDEKLMQEHHSDFMTNESREGIESPQNYGFTSVVMDATKDAMGKVTACAETFISFMGGNRSFPVAGNMDDRRHRLFKLGKGDTAMFRTKGSKQQLHMTDDGSFWSAPRDKTIRMALLDEDSEKDEQQQQQQGGQQGGGGSGGTPTALGEEPTANEELAAFFAAGGSSSSGGSSGGQGQQGQQKHGQEAKYKDNKKSYRYMDITKDETRSGGVNVRTYLQDGKAYLDVNKDKNVYLGGKSGDGNFAMIVTVKGPAKNSKAKT
jgi:hypothetical protein